MSAVYVRVPGRSYKPRTFELELTWYSGQAVLDKIEAVGYDVLHSRPVLGTTERTRILVRALARRWPWYGKRA